MATLESLTEKVVAFRDERDWRQFHNPKDVALSLVLESTELLEQFQWKEGEAAKAATQTEAFRDELADVLYWVLLMAHDHGVDLPSALAAKLVKNAQNYPVAKAKGRASKYSEL